MEQGLGLSSPFCILAKVADLSPAGSLEGHEVPLEKGAGLASSFCILAKASNRGTLVVGHIQ